MTEKKENETDGQSDLIARAVRLSEREGIALSEAMERIEAANSRPRRDPALNSFTVTFTLKPRVATWLRNVMPPTGSHTTDERIAEWMPFVIARAYKENRDLGSEQQEIQKGQAVTVRGKLNEGGRGASIDVTS